jgi:hypothetical protein
VVIASGILYHLDAPDALDFVASIAEVCNGLAILDTYVAARPKVALEWRGRTYHGRHYTEHDPNATPEQKAADLWASIDNIRSFWLTKASLLNLLSDVGFSTVVECHNPAMVHVGEDRITLVAIKGDPAEVLSSTATSGQAPPRWTERRAKLHPSQDPRHMLKKRIGRLLPRPVKRVAKSMLRSFGLLDPELRLPWHR